MIVLFGKKCFNTITVAMISITLGYDVDDEKFLLEIRLIQKDFNYNISTFFL